MTDVAARNRRNRAAGARWQTDLRKGFREEAGFDCERLALTGAEDEGDLVIRDFSAPGLFTVVEAKAGVLHPAEFVRQAVLEAGHFAAHRPSVERDRVTGIAVVKRKGLNWKEAYVLTTVAEYFGLPL